MIAPLIVSIVFAAPLLYAAWTDFTTMRITNRTSLAMLAGFFVTLPLTWAGLPVFAEHMAVGGVFFLAGFAMFAFGWLGGGDAKLMSAIAIWFGWGDAVNFILYTTLVGAGIALFIMLSQRFAPAGMRGLPVLRTLQGNGGDMPYGLALMAGALLVWPGSQIGLMLLA